MNGNQTHEHEDYIQAVRKLAVARLPEGDERRRLEHAKLVYGLGSPGLRGVTVFGTWQNGSDAKEDFIEVCAAGEESAVQLAGTTVHELAHCLAGHKAGHDKEWKQACERLGLRCAKAAGHRYLMAGFEPTLREAILALPQLGDGLPAFHGTRGPGLGLLLPPVRPRPCSLGWGTRGGKSRGPGSGSRQRKYICGCGQIVRAATDALEARCLKCLGLFERA